MSSMPISMVERMEQSVLESIDVETRHVPDGEARKFDARLLEPVDVDEQLRPAPDPDDPLELKTCQRWIDDRGSRGDRRRGRWWIGRRAHEDLLELGGGYVLVVLDETGDVLAYVVVVATVLDELLEQRWTGNGGSHHQGDESAQLPWPAILDPEEVDDE